MSWRPMGSTVGGRRRSRADSSMELTHGGRSDPDRRVAKAPAAFWEEPFGRDRWAAEVSSHRQASRPLLLLMWSNGRRDL